MSGSISLSLDQLLNNLGTPLSGGFITFYQAGTTTLQSAYQDSDLTIPHPNPIELDSVGFVPQLYFADGFIKVRVTDADGVSIFSQDNILVVGPSSGSGGVSVDATTVFDTGDTKWRYAEGTLTGWVRCNGRTIGSATSGATERANADTEDLFTHLWTEDSNLSVSGGRGASAAADWSANKTITLPDARHRTISALGSMGSSNASRLSSTYFGAVSGAAGDTLGDVGGLESHTLTTAQLAVTTPTVASYNLTYSDSRALFTSPNVADAADGSLNIATANTTDTGQAVGGTITMNSFGSGNAHNNTQPTILMTLYIKL